MRSHTLVLLMLVAGIAFTSAVAQTSGPPIRSGGSTLPSTTSNQRTTNPNRQEPCWQVAGVSKTAIQQRQTLARQARQQVESVCANASLSVQQKREQIREIRQREHQQVEGLITPQQQEAIRSCQQSRGGHAGGGGHIGGGHGGGPCGSIPGFEEHAAESNTPEP